MRRAARRLLAPATLLAAGFFFSSAAAADAARSAPSRPGAWTPGGFVSSLPVRKIGRVDYVKLADAAERLDLKLALRERGRVARLSGSGASAELENDSRETTINGLRVFLGEPVLDAAGALYISRIDFERCLAPLLRPAVGAPWGPAPLIIALDPGHGGKDNGTSTNEKVYALDVARRAKNLLQAAGFKVVLTRDEDEYVDLSDRTVIANTKGADVFVSIHFNALPKDTRTSGVEMFTFAPQWQRSAESWSIAGSNDAEEKASPVNRFDYWSTVLAGSIHRRFVNDLKTFDRGKKLAHWGVLRALNCPGVLVECGFLTSASEAKKIALPAYRQRIAQSIAAGIRDYVAVAKK